MSNLRRRGPLTIRCGPLVLAAARLDRDDEHVVARTVDVLGHRIESSDQHYTGSFVVLVDPVLRDDTESDVKGLVERWPSQREPDRGDSRWREHLGLAVDVDREPTGLDSGFRGDHDVPSVAVRPWRSVERRESIEADALDGRDVLAAQLGERRDEHGARDRTATFPDVDLAAFVQGQVRNRRRGSLVVGRDRFLMLA